MTGGNRPTVVLPLYMVCWCNAQAEMKRMLLKLIHEFILSSSRSRDALAVEQEELGRLQGGHAKTVVGE